jgi:hypothetical protein
MISDQNLPKPYQTSVVIAGRSCPIDRPIAEAITAINAMGYQTSGSSAGRQAPKQQGHSSGSSCPEALIEFGDDFGRHKTPPDLDHAARAAGFNVHFGYITARRSGASLVEDNRLFRLMLDDFAVGRLDVTGSRYKCPGDNAVSGIHA